MQQELKKNDRLSLLNHFLYFVFITSTIFSFRAISSTSIGLILLTGLITNRSSLSTLFSKSPVNLFIIGCISFFLLQSVSLIYTQNRQEVLDQLRLKSGVAITPLAVYCSGYLNRRTAKRLFFDFCITLSLASLYCFANIFFRYLQSADLSFFFYHKLVSPLGQHAVYFSIFVFIALVFLLETIREKNTLYTKLFYITLSIYFAIFLFLLSSKLVISFFILYFSYYFIRAVIKKAAPKIVTLGLLILFVLLCSIVLATRNSISNRFSEILKGDIAFVKQDQYNPADYFNGLQFRILQWRLVPEILNEKKAWLTGMGAGNAQDYLDKKYISRNMYTGDSQRKDHGFLGYNTHNQFLQALLQNGIIGLLIFLFTCLCLVRMMCQEKVTGFGFVTLLPLTYALTESVFETQYGIIIFTFFPLLAFFHEMKSKPGPDEYK